ncbi:hypothetical protein PQR34_44810 [Paraburkholderia sediminicola]|uniref:hypothetical protein n=1 Tax=Paraburkholderia sediminicola TaxID=458836 RepID=UPI0038BB3159
MVDTMQASLVYWIGACYRANEPELAQHASPAMTLRDTMNRLARRWERRFDDAAPLLAKQFAKDTMTRADGAMHAALKKAGFLSTFT